MSNRRPTDHLINFRFAIEIEGVTQAAFASCSGLEVEIDVIEFADGNERNSGARKLPGRVHYRNIVLRRGHTNGSDLWNWFKSVTDGVVERRAGSIIVLEADRSEVMRYNFFEAWPCRWKSLELDASQSGGLIEELEIAVERIERA